MTVLIELSSAKHQSLNVVASAIIDYASTQHVLPLSAIEIAQASTCFPIFMTRNKIDGGWAFSAMTSFTLEQNLFVENGKWQPVFQPSSLRTYPLYLMQSPKDNKQFAVGFDPKNPAFSETDGKPLFLAEGKASDHLALVTKLLENDLQHMQQNMKLAQTLEDLDLLKEIDMKVMYANEQFNTIKGLYTINEDMFKMLSADALAKLNAEGYLMPIHAMLLSIFHLNVLINKNNAHSKNLAVSSVKMEVSKAFANI